MSASRTQDVLKLALPIIGGMVSQNLLNLADAWMVGSLGPSALAATGLANFLNFVAVAAITGISPAVQAIAARRAGEGRMGETAVPLNGGLLLSMMIGVPLSAILIFFAPAIFRALNNDPAVISQGSDYLQWRLVAVVAVGMNFSFRGYWSAMKMTRIYMITLIDMHVLNVIFSYSLIHGLFGLPVLGVKGAGIGTTLAIFIGTGIYFWHAHKHAKGHGFLERRPTGDEFHSLLKLGIPSAVQQLLFSGGFTVLFWIIGKVGTAELAVSNVLVTISLTAVLPGIGFGIAAATLCGQALGRGDAADAKRWAWDVYRISLWLFVPLALVMLLLPGPVLTLFVRDATLVHLGRLPLQMVGINILLDALGLIMMQALLGVGASRLVMIVAVGLQWLLFLPAVYLIGPVFAMGLTAIWIAMGVYRLLQTAIFTAAWQRGGWMHLKI
jgi:putative MATE family efflux protein